VGLEGLKGLGADDVLDAAGVLGGDLRAHAHGGQPAGDERVPLVDLFGNLPALVEQSDEAVLVDIYIAVGSQVLHRHADARLGEGELVCNVYGTDVALPVVDDKYGFKVIFR
jgi:hypothetical protein